MHKFINNSLGLMDFAVFPYINHKLCTFEAAPVRLQVGNARWGLSHIELVHSREISRLKLDAVRFVSSIIKPDSPIYCEFDQMKGKPRTHAVNVRIGNAVLEYKVTQAGCFYTVITAFSRRQPVGELIGRLT